MIKTIPKKKKCKNTKCLSEETLQIAVKRREAKGKGEKGRYTHLNAEFQRIAKRDKKALLSGQCKEIEGNNRMGKTRDGKDLNFLFKKTTDTKGTFHAKVKVKVTQLCLTLRDRMDCTAHGILQARILECVAFSFSRGSSQPRDRTHVSLTAGVFFTSLATREAQEYWSR